MNILLIRNLGGFARDFYGEAFARAWESLGHTVIRVTHDTVTDSWAEALQYSPVPVDFMFHSYNSIPLSAVDAMNRGGITTVLYIYDEPYEFSKTKGETPHYCISFNATYRQNIEDHNVLGANMYFLPQAVDTSVYHPVDLTDGDREHYGSDVAFIGTLDDRRMDRTELVKVLGEFDCKLWGPGTTGWVGPEDCNRIYSASRIIVNPAAAASLDPRDAGRNMAVGEYTCRVYNTAAAGAFQLAEYRPDTYVPYIPDMEMALYMGIQVLGDSIEYYLTNEGARVRTAREGYFRTLRDHTILNRAQAVVSHVELYKEDKLGRRLDV